MIPVSLDFLFLIALRVFFLAFEKGNSILCNMQQNDKSQILLLLGAVVVVIILWLDLQLPMQSVPITTNVVCSNPTQAIQHYVIKFVSDLRQVCGFLWVLRFPPPLKLTATI